MAVDASRGLLRLSVALAAISAACPLWQAALAFSTGDIVLVTQPSFSRSVDTDRVPPVLQVRSGAITAFLCTLALHGATHDHECPLCCCCPDFQRSTIITIPAVAYQVACAPTCRLIRRAECSAAASTSAASATTGQALLD